MIEQVQLNLHRPAEGSIGDCVRTCIACLFNLPPADVPHFLEDVWDSPDAATISHQRINEWSAVGGLQFVEYPIACNRAELGLYLQDRFRDLHVIIGCRSRNGPHAVIMKNHDYMWDPSRDKSGCEGPMDDGFYWIGFFVRKL